MQGKTYEELLFIQVDVEVGRNILDQLVDKIQTVLADEVLNVISADGPVVKRGGS